MVFDGVMKWIEKIKNSPLSEGNKEALIEYLKYTISDKKYYPKFSFFVFMLVALTRGNNSLNLKHLKREEMISIFDFLYNSQWLYTPVAFLLVKFFTLDLLEFLNKKYNWGLEPRRESRVFLKKKKSQIRSQIEAEYGTN